jgi:anti-sigma B factor antagonist
MIVTEKKDQTVIVRPTGDITAINAEEFRKDLQELVNAGQIDLMIDLNNVGMIDSKGLSVFILCHQAVSAKGGTLKVVTDNPDLRGLFHVMRLDEHFTVCGS